jgi:Na+/proline symporter
MRFRVNMNSIDTYIIIAYMVVVIGVGILAGLKQDFESYWVNRRKTSTFLLIFSIVSTQVGAGAIVGLASAAYSSGIGYGLVALVSTVGGLLLVAVFAPKIKQFGDAHKAVTLSEFFGVRYGRTTEILAGIAVMLAYISFLGAQFVATGTLLHLWGGIDFTLALLLSSVALILYTSFAGLRGDILTDFVHFIVMAIVFFIFLIPGVHNYGTTFQDLLTKLPASHWSPTTFGGVGFLVGGLFFGIILSLVSMEIWQRVYAANGPRQARSVFTWGALLIIPFYILAIFIGLVARARYEHLASPDMAIFQVFQDQLPSGLLGLGIAALLAAFMSTANSMMLVLSATIVRNFFNIGKRLEANDRQRKALLFSRFVTLAVGGIGLAFALLLPDIVQLSLNAFYLIGLLFPPLLGGVLWRRSTARAANLSIIIGMAATIVALPFIPRQAFIAAAVLAIPTFVIASKMTKHTSTESTDLGTSLR